MLKFRQSFFAPMKLEDYQTYLSRISHGKKLPGALYLYRDESASFGLEIDRLLSQIIAVYGIGGLMLSL